MASQAPVRLTNVGAGRWGKLAQTVRLKLGLAPEEITEALMVCVNPCGAKVLTYGVTCMLEAIEEMGADSENRDD